MMTCPDCSNRFPVLNTNSEDYINSYSIIVCPRCSSKLRLVEGVRKPIHFATAAVPVLISGAMAAALSTVSITASILLTVAIVVGFILKKRKQAETKRNYSIEFHLEKIPDEELLP